MIMEYCDKGDLSAFIERMNLGSIGEVRNNLMDLGEHRIWRFVI